MIKRGKNHFFKPKKMGKNPLFTQKGGKTPLFTRKGGKIPPFNRKRGKIPLFTQKKPNNTHIFQYYLHKKVSGYINGARKFKKQKKTKTKNSGMETLPHPPCMSCCRFQHYMQFILTFSSCCSRSDAAWNTSSEEEEECQEGVSSSEEDHIQIRCTSPNSRTRGLPLQCSIWGRSRHEDRQTPLHAQPPTQGAQTPNTAPSVGSDATTKFLECTNT